MAIRVQQQVTSLSGLILGVTTGVTCPRCTKPYADLRRENVSASRGGVPAPFVAPTWGQAARQQQVIEELRDVIADRDANGIDRWYGSSRCPHCRLAVQFEPDTRVVGMRAWVAVGAFIAVLVAAAVAGLAMNLPAETHAEAEDSAIGLGVATFLAIFALVCGYGYMRRRSARRERDQALSLPSPSAPAWAATPDQWAAIQKVAAALGVESAAWWFSAASSGKNPAPAVAPTGVEVEALAGEPAASLTRRSSRLDSLGAARDQRRTTNGLEVATRRAEGGLVETRDVRRVPCQPPPPGHVSSLGENRNPDPGASSVR